MIYIPELNESNNENNYIFKLRIKLIGFSKIY